MKPVTELILLEELLRQILQVTLGEGHLVAGDNDLLPSSITGNLHGLTQLPGLSVHLELVMQKILKGGRIKDSIRDGATAVNDKLAALSRGIGRGGLRIMEVNKGYFTRRRFMYLRDSHSGK